MLANGERVPDFQGNIYEDLSGKRKNNRVANPQSCELHFKQVPLRFFGEKSIILFDSTEETSLFRENHFTTRVRRYVLLPVLLRPPVHVAPAFPEEARRISVAAARLRIPLPVLPSHSQDCGIPSTRFSRAARPAPSHAQSSIGCDDADRAQVAFVADAQIPFRTVEVHHFDVGPKTLLHMLDRVVRKVCRNFESIRPQRRRVACVKNSYGRFTLISSTATTPAVSSKGNPDSFVD